MPYTAKALLVQNAMLKPQFEQIADLLRGMNYEIVIGPEHRPPAKTEFPPEDWAKYFDGTQLVVTTARTHYPRPLLAYATQLLGLVYCTTGTESVDVRDANDLGIVIGHGPSSQNIDSMSEATVLMILAIMYNLRLSEQAFRENLPRPAVMHARMLRGKTLGVIGLGRIARGVIRRLSGWGVEFLATTRNGAASHIPDGVSVVLLEELLRRSDIVCVLTTLTPETRHMLGAEQFAMMKNDAVLVNTARGGMTDEAALYEALRTGSIGGAAIDAFEQEPLPMDNLFRTLDNVVLTPHLVGHTREVYDAIPPLAVENVRRIVAGEMPVHCRNPEVEQQWRSRLERLAG
jgi:phosphoglycerate dehydrogenase-like enzyme